MDASPVGFLAAVLTEEDKPVFYASRALSGVEQRYSRTAREPLAVVWACEHFSLFVIGTRFKVVTDHLPLLGIWKRADLRQLRLARWALRLSTFDVEIKYQPGKDNPADYMSRHPGTTKSNSDIDKIAEEYIRLISSSATPVALTTQEIEVATAHDQTLQAVTELVRNGNWHNLSAYENDTNVDFQALITYRSMKDELTVSDKLVFRDHRIVVPAALQKRAIELAHEGHQGVSKTKALIRTKVWFPNIDKMVEEAVSKCIPCQANSNRCAKEPLLMSELPRGPWLNLSIDFCGPLPTGEYLFVIIDEYSRYPIVEVVRSTSADSTITVLEKVFALFGYPEVVKSDNGPPFQSHAFKSYMTSIGIKHRRIMPRWPQANSQAEGFNKPLMKAVRSAVMYAKDWRHELQVFLRAYRCTPHSSTLFTPHRLMFGREARTKLPETRPDINPQEFDAVRIRDRFNKEKAKIAADARNKAKPRDVMVGDSVLVKRDEHPGKFQTPFKPEPWSVYDRKGPMVTIKRGKKYVTRNVSQMRKIPTVPEDESDDDTDDIPTESTEAPVTPNSVPGDHRTPPPTPHNPQTPDARPNSRQTPDSLPTSYQPPTMLRPQRRRKPPSYLKDYV